MLIKRHQLLSFSIVILLPIPFPVPNLLLHPSSNSLSFYSLANMSLHPHDETVPIRVEDVTFNENPQLFFSGMQFDITLFCNRVLPGAIQCRITYQNVASQRLNTQIIGTTFIEPPALGRKVIVLQASTPELEFIPEEHLMDETRIYIDLICNDVSFVSIPISVSHSYDDERLNQFRRDCVFVYHVLRHFKCFCCEEVMYQALAI